MKTSHLEFGTKRVPLQLQTEAAECGLACFTLAGDMGTTLSGRQ